MAGISMRIPLDETVIASKRRDDIRFSERHTDERVGGIQGPEVAGPFATGEQWTELVNHALAFYKEVVMVYDLGDNLPPIAVAKGSRMVEIPKQRHCQTRAVAEEGCDYCLDLFDADDNQVSYMLRGYSFSSLGDALVMALALRDRRNPNDAMWTSKAVRRLLQGDYTRANRHRPAGQEG